jgi:phosphoglycerate dehydrogenase-like enzyme
VLKALDDGIVFGLATDVLHDEPAPNTHPYFARKNILVTPHISAYTMECLRGMGEKCVEDVVRIAHGEKPEHALT